MAVERHQRYATPWRQLLLDAAKPYLKEGCSVLDIGSGRSPAIRRDERPANCHYVGLDISRSELDLAPEDSYSEARVGDATTPLPELSNQFDLVISWQVLEHVSSTAAVLDAMHSYLRNDGVMISMVSGKNSLFALPNRVLPFKLSVFMMEKLLGRKPETVFPAVYDLCSYDELKQALSSWSHQEVHAFWRGSGYLRFSSVLRRIYLTLEDYLSKTNRRGLATHYLIVANR